MTTPPPAASEPEADDPVGMRYPNMARIWNYHLQGKDNFEIDRRAAEAVNVRMREIGAPSAAETAVETRHLLQRMVDYMLGQGIRQFPDLGSGSSSRARDSAVSRAIPSPAAPCRRRRQAMRTAPAAAALRQAPGIGGGPAGAEPPRPDHSRSAAGISATAVSTTTNQNE